MGEDVFSETKRVYNKEGRIGVAGDSCDEQGPRCLVVREGWSAYLQCMWLVLHN